MYNKQQLYTEDDVARWFMEFTGDEPPCNFNDMDAYTDDWCWENCPVGDDKQYIECWKHAMREGWFSRRLLDERGCE